jgi:acyl-CoA reductase-like NAD-dependent aldehyde dehydrogenase
MANHGCLSTWAFVEQVRRILNHLYKQTSEIIVNLIIFLFRFADLIDRDAVIIANLDSLDNGKPFTAARGDIYFCSMLLRYYAGFADKVHGRTMPVDGPMFSYTRKEPLGVCGQILPWNYPALMVVFKWAPLLAAGCVRNDLF